MKHGILSTSIVVLSACVFATACGSPNQSTSGQTTSVVNSTSGTKTAQVVSNSTNNNSTNHPAPIQLTNFTGLSQAGIQVKVPQGWTKTSIQGGDYSGWKFTNPNDSNESELIVQSTCVGCYLNASGQPNPALVIPQGDSNVKTVNQTTYSIRYQFTKHPNINVGNGLLITSKNETGYSYVETLLPSTQNTASSEILASFSYNT